MAIGTLHTAPISPASDALDRCHCARRTLGKEVELQLRH